jgi:hypothetical protein
LQSFAGTAGIACWSTTGSPRGGGTGKSGFRFTILGKPDFMTHTTSNGIPIKYGDWVLLNENGRKGIVTHLCADIDGQRGYINVQVDVHENIHLAANTVNLWGGAKTFGRYNSPADSL